MVNTKPVGVAYSDPELTAGTTVAGGTVSSAGVLAGAAFSGGTNTDISLAGTRTVSFSTVAAAGASQGNATSIASTVQRVVVTVTASTQGVKLPTAATGKEITIFMPGSVGVKVYPGSGANIDASSTNTAVVLAAGKANIYFATSATKWKTMKGA